jgi:hypothetical protein
VRYILIKGVAEFLKNLFLIISVCISLNIFGLYTDIVWVKDLVTILDVIILIPILFMATVA